MGTGSRAVVLGVALAALLAGSGWEAAAAGASQHATEKTVTFGAQHVAGARGLVLTEGPGLVVYTFAGDKRGQAGTCTGQCAAIWPPLHGVPVLAHGARIPGTFRRVGGQVTYNGWPLYLFTGEKPRQDHADGSFKVVTVPASAHAPSQLPAPAPTPTGSW